MSDRALNHQSGATNRSRFYPSIRTILLVRFDPGTRDRFRPDEVRLETNPNPFLNDRSASEIKFSDLQTSNFTDTRKRQRFNELIGRTSISLDGARAAITSINTNLADAVAKIPVDGLSRFLDITPYSSSRRVNSYRIPDELELTFSWKSVPLDSRLIRSMIVFHYEGTVTADAFGEGVPERAPDVPIPTGYLIPATGANLRFIGQVDEISDTHGDGGDSVTLKARDLTALLLDAKIPPGIEKRIQPGTTILEVIRALLDTNPEFALIRGPYTRITGNLPVLDPKRYARLAVSPKERHRNKNGGTPYVVRYSAKAGNESYWDAITDLCVSHGLVPTIELDSIVVLEPRTLYKSAPTILTQPGVPRFPTPGGHREQIGDFSQVRRMIYGINLKELRFFRKLARIKAPAVQVTSFNPDALEAKRRLLSVTHPPNFIAQAKAGAISAKSQIPSGGSSAQATKVSASGQVKTVEVHNVVVHGIVDEAMLRRIAEQVYEAMGRQEFGVTFSTDDVASFSDNPEFDPNLDPDLLDLRAGDPIQVLVTPSDRRANGGVFSLSELNLLVQRSKNVAQATGANPELTDAIAYLEDQGFRNDEAVQLVRVLSTANLPVEFRVNTVQVNFDGGEEGAGGFSLSIDARDYMRVRADPTDVSQTKSFDAVVPGGVVT